MKHQSGFHWRFCCLLMLGIGWSGGGFAAPVSVQIAPSPGGSAPVLLDWSGQADADETGVLVEDRTGNGGQVAIELFPGASQFNLQTPDGFVLLDNTLRVNSSLPAGGSRIRLRIAYERLGIRIANVRANTIRILRADIAGGRWIRAVDGIRDLVNADVRYLRGIRTDFILGHHGVDNQNEFAWAVLDSSGDQYFALAGLTNVPLPAAWLMFLSGSGLLLMVTRKKSRSGT